MKTILAYSCLFIILINFVTACKKSETTQANGKFEVALYNCNKKSEPYICFDSLITDNRCPEDVVCIWSGYAMIKVSFHENRNTHIFKMAIPNIRNLFFDAPADTTINGYRIVFSDLQPYPNTSKPPVPIDKIKAVITISH